MVDPPPGDAGTEPARPFTGVVLTGGASRRMGRDKGFLDPGDGGPVLARRAFDALMAAGASRCLAVGGDAGRLRSLGFVPVPDDHPGDGPLAGLVTALVAADADTVVVLSCDLPAIDGATVRTLVDLLGDDLRRDAVVPVVDGHRQVLAAAYRTSVHRHLASRLAAGERSVRRALSGLSVHEWSGADPHRLVDLDLPEDVDHYAQGRRSGSFGNRPPTGRG